MNLTPPLCVLTPWGWLRIFVSLIILVLAQPPQKSALQQLIHRLRSIDLRPHTWLLKPRCHRPNHNINILEYLIHVVIVRILPIVRVQIPRWQSPFNIRRSQRRQILPVLGSEPVNLAARGEGVVAPDTVLVIVEREAVLGRVSQVPVGAGPLVKPLFRAEVAEARVSTGFSGEWKFAGEAHGAQARVSANVAGILGGDAGAGVVFAAVRVCLCCVSVAIVIGMGGKCLRALSEDCQREEEAEEEVHFRYRVQVLVREFVRRPCSIAIYTRRAATLLF